VTRAKITHNRARGLPRSLNEFGGNGTCHRNLERHSNRRRLPMNGDVRRPQRCRDWVFSRGIMRIHAGFSVSFVSARASRRATYPTAARPGLAARPGNGVRQMGGVVNQGVWATKVRGSGGFITHPSPRDINAAGGVESRCYGSRMGRSWKRMMLATTVAAALALVAAAWLAPFVAQDRCLDSGGAWENGRCLR
jgi:hypothetical protein